MIHYKIHNNVAELPKRWDDFIVHDIFLHTNYLKALESASPNTISLYYVSVFKDGKLVGIALIQRVELYAKDMFRSESSSKTKAFFKDAISRILKGNILVIGNLTHTGQHGLFFDKISISQFEFVASLFDAVKELKLWIKNHKRKSIRAILFKDYFNNDRIHLEEEQFKRRKFYHVNVQPNMVLQIRPDWHSMSDYLGDLTTKYRTRHKRAKKKLGNIQRKELLLQDIETKSARLYQLYINVCNNASFNTFVLPPNHFYQLKLYLKDNFRVFGYYLQDELIGFYTLIWNNDTLETYFLGYDPAHQYDNQLYLNMLYDMIDFGITNQLKTIVYARTAMEIKSSVGAKSKEMTVYIKHTNRLINALLQPIFKLMNPKQEWDERHPFR